MKNWCCAGINPPSWRESAVDQRRRFYDEVRAILITQPENRSDVNRQAQLITDALSGVGLLDQLLRDPYVEEIFVRNGEVAVEYDGSFHHLGKLADDRYFENLAVHVADQGGATLRGDRPAVLIDLPGGERFTAIVPRLSTEGTAINIRTFGRRGCAHWKRWNKAALLPVLIPLKRESFNCLILRIQEKHRPTYPSAFRN